MSSTSAGIAATNPGAIATTGVTAMPSMLVILPYPPNPLRPRTVSMLADLASFAQIDLIYLNHGERCALPGIPLRSAKVIPNPWLSRMTRLAAGCVIGRPFVYQYYHSSSLRKHLETIDLSSYDAIYVERIPVNELGISHVNIVLDVPDCYTNLVRQFASHLRGPRRLLYQLDSLRIQEYEARLCNSAAKVICVAQREADGFRSIGVTKPILVLVHASNAMRFAKRQVQDQPKKILSFHGKLSYIANATALRKIEEAILPHLPDEDYEIHVAGAGSQHLRMHSRIRKIGYVDDIVDYLRSVDLSMFPMDLSCGLANKVLESLAAGAPAIVTPQVAEGLPNWAVLRERGIYVREIQGFPDAIRAYFALPLPVRQQISDACRDYVKRLHNPDERRALLKRYVLQQ